MIFAYPQPNCEDKHKVKHKDSDVNGLQHLLGKHIPWGGHRGWGGAGGLHGFLCRLSAPLSRCIYLLKNDMVTWLGDLVAAL